MEKLTPYMFIPDSCEIKPDIDEIYRYMGMKGQVTEDLSKLVNECLSNVYKELSPKGCYMIMPVNIKENEVDFELFCVNSKALLKELENVCECVLFCATIGPGIDRLIMKYSSVSPIHALIYQAIGTEMIEKFCDMMCEHIVKENSCSLGNRFSPGYEDFDLSYQKKIADILNIEKRCGITLSEYMIMRPSKSVTAISGITCKTQRKNNKCNFCKKANCQYRSSEN